MKSLSPLKATVIDDDAFRLLAIPYSGPIPSPKAPRGMDRDGEWFSHRTEINPEWFDVRLVDWHHRGDPRIGRSILGKAIDLAEDDDGWWVTVWLNRQKAEFAIIRKIIDAGGELFGSSESIKGMTRKDLETGEILRWPYIAQTLSPMPRNINSVLVPLKAAIIDMRAEEIDVPSFFDDLANYVDNLATDFTDKAGRVLAERNEVRLREAVEELTESGWSPAKRKAALAKISSVLDELDRYLTI